MQQRKVMEGHEERQEKGRKKRNWKSDAGKGWHEKKVLNRSIEYAKE